MIRMIILISLMAGGALWGQSANPASARAPKPAAATNAPAGTPAAGPDTAMPAAEDTPAGHSPAGIQRRMLLRHPYRRALVAGATRATDGAAGAPAAPADGPTAKPSVVSTAPAAVPAVMTQARAAKPAAVAGHLRYRPERFARRAGLYYDLWWGVDSLSVKWTESGEVIRFSYRVVDADKAKALNDKRAEPSLIDPRAGVKLVVPSLEKIGQLRQSSTPVDGKSYWMAFSNKGRRVKRGDHVDVVIGQFRANGLVVD